jgi:hypothetical protein
VTPILPGTASRLGLRKPPRVYKYSEHGLVADSLHRWVGIAPTLEEACANIDHFRRVHLGEYLTHYEIHADGHVVDNMERLRQRGNGNANL